MDNSFKEYDFQKFIRGKIFIPTEYLIAVISRFENIDRGHHEIMEDKKSDISTVEEFEKNNKNFLFYLKSDKVFQIAQLVVTVIIAIFTIFIPVSQNNEIIKRQQAVQIYPYILEKGKSCSDARTVENAWENQIYGAGSSANGVLKKNGLEKNNHDLDSTLGRIAKSIKNNNDEWVICVKNSSNLPVYNFKLSIEMIQIVEGTNPFPFYFDMPLKSDLVQLHILYPGSSSIVADINPTLNSKLSGSKNHEFTLSTKNRHLLIKFSFIDNAGVEWKSVYRVENLYNLDKMKFYIEEEIHEAK